MSARSLACWNRAWLDDRSAATIRSGSCSPRRASDSMRTTRSTTAATITAGIDEQLQNEPRAGRLDRRQQLVGRHRGAVRRRRLADAAQTTAKDLATEY